MKRWVPPFGLLAGAVVVTLAIAGSTTMAACSTTSDGSAFTIPDSSAPVTDATMGLPDGPMFQMTPDAPPVVMCTGLQCVAQKDDCQAKGMTPTSITGTVYDPAGNLPLYDVYVYIPNTTPSPIPLGHPTCTQCQAPASGSPIVGTLTDADGNFTLTFGSGGSSYGVPSGTNVPLVIQVGKWRKQIQVPSVPACQQTAIPNPANPIDKLRLPAKSSEGDMPRMAFTSGCDPAECFLRHIGIDDSEFVPPTSTTGHVHFYTGQDGSSIAGGNTYEDTYQWWSSVSNLQQYDIIFNACECNENDRGPQAYPAMHQYLETGGRLFTTHYYFNWFTPPDGISGYVSYFTGVVNWTPNGSGGDDPSFFVDTTFPKGKSFADWLDHNNISTVYGQVDLVDTRNDMSTTKPESSRWIYNDDVASDPNYYEMYMSFNVPVGKPASQQCGRAVFSDVHLSGSSNLADYPGECGSTQSGGMDYSTNEKALEFLFFDLSSCVQDNTAPPTVVTPM